MLRLTTTSSTVQVKGGLSQQELHRQTMSKLRVALVQADAAVAITAGTLNAL
jgi:hypothetical protein